MQVRGRCLALPCAEGHVCPAVFKVDVGWQSQRETYLSQSADPIQGGAMLDSAQALGPEMIRIRRAIHANPELSFQEFQTAALVADTLNEIGGYQLTDALQ